MGSSARHHDDRITVDLMEYPKIAHRRWRVIAACFVIVLGLAIVYTALVPAQYQSSTQLLISSAQGAGTDYDPTDNAYNGGLAATQRASSYAELVTQGDLTRRVIRDLDLGLKPSELAEKISASAAPGSMLIKINVTDHDPKVAQRIARTTAEELRSTVRGIETSPGSSRALVKATITDPASLPESPVSPGVVRNLGLAVVLGLLVGLGAAFVREMLDTTLRTRRDVSNVLSAPVLGTVPDDPGSTGASLIVDLEDSDPRVEAFRVVRANAKVLDSEVTSKILTVTSAAPDGAKSTTAVNIATSMTVAGHRTLLVDVDLRRPRLGELMRLGGVAGLADVLRGDVSVEDVVQTDRSGLHVLTSGAMPDHPSELLDSRTTADLLAKLRADYDVVVLDAPPLLPVTDGALLAARSDGAVVVVRHAVTTKEELTRAAERLAAVGAKTLGAVLHGVPDHKRSYDYTPTRESHQPSPR